MTTNDANAAAIPAAPPALTPRERQVLQLIAHGLDIATVSSRLAVSPDTARTHLRSARARLGARTRAHAVAIALERGMIDPVTAPARGLEALVAGRR